MKFFRYIFRKAHRTQRTKKQWVKKGLVITAKCLAVILIPAPFAAAVSWFWYYELYMRGIHLAREAEVIATAAWIPIFGLIYAIKATAVYVAVWNEYKDMRMALKRYDKTAFMLLRDEAISPLVHTLIAVLSFMVLGGFMSLNYPDVTSGLMFVASTAYVLFLYMLAVREIDNPCAGLWFMKGIPLDWRTDNADEYLRKKFCKMESQSATNNAHSIFE